MNELKKLATKLVLSSLFCLHGDSVGEAHAEMRIEHDTYGNANIFSGRFDQEPVLAAVHEVLTLDELLTGEYLRGRTFAVSLRDVRVTRAPEWHTFTKDDLMRMYNGQSSNGLSSAHTDIPLIQPLVSGRMHGGEVLEALRLICDCVDFVMEETPDLVRIGPAEIVNDQEVGRKLYSINDSAIQERLRKLPAELPPGGYAMAFDPVSNRLDVVMPWAGSTRVLDDLLQLLGAEPVADPDPSPFIDF